MNQILTYVQAQAVGAAFSAAAVAGGRVTRITFMQDDGRRIKVSVLRDGVFLVLRIDERGTVTAHRRYDGLADFADAHREAT